MLGCLSLVVLDGAQAARLPSLVETDTSVEHIAKLVKGTAELVFVHRERQVADVDGESWCRGRLFWLHAAPLDGQTLARLWASTAID